MTRRALTLKAAREALRVRKELGVSADAPLSPIDAALNLGVEVRMLALPSAEGFYVDDPPLILLSSERPAGRQATTCAHELAHYVFGHQTAATALWQDAARASGSEEEFLAEQFSSMFLMPRTAVVAGASRAGGIERLNDPETVFRLSCWLGVGFGTLVHHLERNLSLVDSAAASLLRRHSPAAEKARWGLKDVPGALWLVDRSWCGRALDVQVGDWLVGPASLVVEGITLESVGGHARFLSPGIGRVSTHDGAWASFVRVSRAGYVGLARFRHEPEAEEDAE